MTARPTGEVELRPSFIEALKRVAPRQRRSRAWYVVLIVVLGVAAAFAASPSLREFIATVGRSGPAAR